MIHVKISNNGNSEILSFPASENYIESALERIGAPKGKIQFVAEELQPEELNLLRNNLVNIDEINYLAKRIDSFYAEEPQKFYVAAKHEGFNTVKDLINLTFNLACYTLIQDIGNADKIGRKHYLTMHGGITKTQEEEIDFAKIGKELMQSGKFIWTDYGLLFKNAEIEFNEVYDGRNFPPYWYDGERLMSVEIEFEGRKEYIYLPCEEIAIQKAIQRLGADDPSRCVYSLDEYEFDSEALQEKIGQHLNNDDIYEINNFIDIINNAGVDIDKLMALIKCGDDDSLAAATILAERIEEFEYIRNMDDSEDVGKYIINNSCEYELSEELEDFFDFSSFGDYFADENNGQFINGGFVYGDRSVEEVLHQSMGIKMGGI